MYLAAVMKLTAQKKENFTGLLMQWHEETNKRVLPWKKENDPYKIWLSEIILQQTRVEQGTPYYHRFMEQYPTIFQLAKAEDEEVYRLWQGLGYYNRCKNLLYTARYIVAHYNGEFPEAYEDILQLKGIGTYTAAAIASFAFGKAHAVVDGNVVRVLARFWGIQDPVDVNPAKKHIEKIAHELINKKQPGVYNQAIMDFGATVCKPQLPHCDNCMLAKDCYARQHHLVNLLPLKSKKIIIKKRHFNYILLETKNKLWVEKRMGKDIWHHLYQPFLIEKDTRLTAAFILQNPDISKLPINQIAFEESLQQKLTHQHIVMHFFSARMKRIQIIHKNGQWVDKKDLKKLAFPKTIVSFFEKKGYF